MCPQPVFRLFFNYFFRKTVMQLRDFIGWIIAGILNQSGEFTKVMPTLFLAPYMAINNRVIGQSGNTLRTRVYQCFLVQEFHKIVGVLIGWGLIGDKHTDMSRIFQPNDMPQDWLHRYHSSSETAT